MTSPTPHPLHRLFQDWLPECDFGVLHHGFSGHGRDYVLEIELGAVATAPGRYELLFTHVTALTYETRVGDDVWPISWDDSFIDHETWIKAGEPEGYVWGTNWSLAYPGISAIQDSPIAETWAKRIGKPFFEASLETDRFLLSLVFHDLRTKKTSEISDTVDQVVIPLK